jgi:translocation and assembly module TamB
LRLSGVLEKGGARGNFTQGAGHIGNVPILISEAHGGWRFAGAELTLDGRLRAADAAEKPRYSPVVSDDFRLRLADGRIVANGTARHPGTGTAIANVAIRHALGPGTGDAIIDMPSLTFDRALQPEQLTPVTLGVVANVFGSMSGRGNIVWTPDGVTSTGRFRTGGLDMAAAFGPVTGLSGEIAFSDLLGLETAPGQQVRIAAINPGILVTDGEIRYRLLPGLKLQVEAGEWPFAGGKLRLEPTILDLSEAAERRLTFKVEGLDAARFIAALEFENIAATGVFDGELPMIFDKNGGRIVGGSLVARDGGGTLSYVGQISNEQLGPWGQIAFDALKAIKYSRLSISLDGALDGDVITRISFAGVNQAPVSGPRAKLPIPVKIIGLNNIPFIFNVTITAKFRQLFEMARSFDDPSILINRALPQLEPVPREPANFVKPPASGTAPQ